MRTYMDKMFCDFADCKKRNECEHFITEEIREDSKKSNLYMEVFENRPECFEKEE